MQIKSFLLPLLVLGTLGGNSTAQNPELIKVARLKYAGGGDWYANRTALPNLLQFCRQNLGMSLALKEDIVEPGSPDLFRYPWVYMTGHGNFVFHPKEAANLRKYLVGGGFLHIDDNYGLDPFVRPQLKKVFPELDLVELPAQHPLFQKPYVFRNGLPKIHEHDGKPAQAFGLIYEGRLVCLYTYESDLGNGWEDAGIYPDDTPEKREAALKMGANLLEYVLGGETLLLKP